MGMLCDDVVMIREAEREGDGATSVITVNCPDKTGLGCDLCRLILFFGLTIVRFGNPPKILLLSSICTTCLFVFLSVLVIKSWVFAFLFCDIILWCSTCFQGWEMEISLCVL